MKRHVTLFVVAGMFAGACTSSSNSSGSSPPSTSADTTTTTAPGYSATITRTEFGIPHIVADDWASLGFGQGYAFAQDRSCTLIDQVIKVRGERAKWFGAGDGDTNLNSDFTYRHLGLHDDADQRFANQPANIADMLKGYVDGFDAELTAEGPHGWCEGQPWVQPISTTDLYAYLNSVVLFASSGVLVNPIATAQPPARETTDTAPTTSSAGSSRAPLSWAPSQSDLASNGWAIGSSLSDNGGGMLLANPHFPWEGEKRLWESQLTLTTGELNVYGATLSGVPGVLIGFNQDVAWTHTVSAGYRMTLYELNLAPGDPTSYIYGDTTKKMTPTDISIDVKQADGTIKTQQRTMWSSHYGPMLNLPFGWSTTKAYTMRDANIDNADVLTQFLGVDQAISLDALIDTHRTSNGVPWVNTVATSADGRTWYADTSSTPNLSPDALTTWKDAVAAGGLAKTALDNGAILLDGSDPANEWVNDPQAVRPGILAFDSQPKLERDDYVFNSNDSHWLANPAQPLTGFSDLTGPEGSRQSARTRMNALLLTDPLVRGTDGKFSLAELQAAIFSNRSLTSEILLSEVVAACNTTQFVPIDGKLYPLADACDVLRSWDGAYNVDSRGAPLWREFLQALSKAGTELYAVHFDPTDPLGTPKTLNPDSVSVLTGLATAAQAMIAAGFPIDIALGDMQFDGRPIAERIPLPGGTNLEGTASIVSCCSNPSTLAPKGDRGTKSATQTFSDKGYPVTNGNSFIMTVEFTKNGPHAEALLTYGQPDDVTSPDFTSQTKLFSTGKFRAVLFTDAEISSDPKATTVTVSGPKG